MASVDKRPNGKYRARWRPVAGGPQKTKTFDRKLDAQRFVAEVEHRSAIGTYVDPRAGRRPFGEVAQAWAEVQSWKASSRQAWGQHTKRLQLDLGDTSSLWDLPVAQVDRMTLDRLRVELERRYTRRVVRQTMVRALAVMRYAHASGLVGRDVSVGVETAPKRRADDAPEHVTSAQVPTRTEALAILTNTAPDYRAAVALGLAGLRIGEVLGMAADRIDLADRQVRIDRQASPLPGGMTLTTPKAEKCRTITVPAVVAVELRRHLRDLDGQLLFPGSSNGLLRPDSFRERAWYPALRAAGLEGRFKFHALRHFCASTLLAEGAPITAVAGHLGDTVATVQSTYAHWLRDDRDVPAAVLDRVLALDTAESCGAED
jgi:integrase